MKVDYRDGRAAAHATFIRDSGPDIHIVATSEGTSLSYRDSTGHAHEFRPAERRTVVQSRDAEGNWSRKATVERDPATGDEVVTASTDRTITYY